MTTLDPQEKQFLQDRSLYNQLGPEDPKRTCKNDGCSRGAIPNSAFCRAHHFEQVEHRKCPFDH
jgi:hypothetical protein